MWNTSATATSCNVTVLRAQAWRCAGTVARWRHRLALQTPQHNETIDVFYIKNYRSHWCGRKKTNLKSAISWESSAGKGCYTHGCFWSICIPHRWSSPENIWNQIWYVRHYPAPLFPILLARCRHSHFHSGLRILFLWSNLTLMTPSSRSQTVSITTSRILTLRRWLAQSQSAATTTNTKHAATGYGIHAASEISLRHKTHTWLTAHQTLVTKRL